MERNEANYALVNSLNCLPKKMLALHGTENMTEFVLHELCKPDCFNLKRAAYFIDNPDFNCFKGIAGVTEQEAYRGQQIWDDAEQFSNHMKESSFNQKVRSVLQPSMRKSGKKDTDLVALLSEQLGLAQPHYCSWDMKHDNHGLLVYEVGVISCPISEDVLLNGVCLLGFCPIY